MRADAHVPLGRTSVAITRFGLGAATLSGMFQSVPEEQGLDAVEQAWALGIRYFDTAPLYGGGEAERRLGRALAEKPREEFVVSTKVGRLVGPDPEFDFSYDAVLRSVEASLDRLCLDRVDVLLIHDPEERHMTEAVSGAYRALDRLRSEGMIRAVGAGVNQVEPFMRLASETELDCCLLAGRYTLLDSSAAAELLPFCKRRGIGVVIGGVYNSGVLARPAAGATFDYTPAAPEIIDRVHRLEATCARHGVPLKAAAVQFPFHHPAVTAVLIGSASRDEVEENVRMIETPVPTELWKQLLLDEQHA